jgi:hypothetical protein
MEQGTKDCSRNGITCVWLHGHWWQYSEDASSGVTALPGFSRRQTTLGSNCRRNGASQPLCCEYHNHDMLPKLYLTLLLHYSLTSRLHNRHLLLHIQKICHCPCHKLCKPYSNSGQVCHFLGHLNPPSEVCLIITVSTKLLFK